MSRYLNILQDEYKSLEEDASKYRQWLYLSGSRANNLEFFIFPYCTF